MAADDFKNTDVNFKLETKVGGQMEDYMLVKAVIIENHRKPRDYEKKTFEKMVDDVKANNSYTVPRLQEPSSEKLGTAGLNDMKANTGHIVPRFQEPSSEKLGNAGLTRNMTVGTNKDKMIAIKEGTDIKARQRIKPNKVCARVDVRAETRDNVCVHTRVDERVHTTYVTQATGTPVGVQ